MNEAFMDSECVSCGACVQACPTATLVENSVIAIGQPEHSAVTTCAYCGVGCAFKAEMRGEEIVRMVPWKDGKANHGHSCIKGRFAYGYALHRDRVLSPMIREKITDPWREVSWEEAINYAASEFKRIQAKYGRLSVGGITSSRCTCEETYLMQKIIRSGFGNNNVDTCARVCHSPTGYGLSQAFGTSAGTQDFDSVEEADVVLIIGCNPTDAHPVVGSQIKKRLREGAKLIVIDPRRTELVRTPHIEAAYHLALKPGTNVAIVTALAHVIVTEGLPMKNSCANVATSTNIRIGLHSSPRSAIAPKPSRNIPAFRRNSFAARRVFMQPAAMPRFIMASASPSTAKARQRSWPSPISPWRQAILADAALA